MHFTLHMFSSYLLTEKAYNRDSLDRDENCVQTPELTIFPRNVTEVTLMNKCWERVVQRNGCKVLIQLKQGCRLLYVKFVFDPPKVGNQYKCYFPGFVSGHWFINWRKSYISDRRHEGDLLLFFGCYWLCHQYSWLCPL